MLSSIITFIFYFSSKTEEKSIVIQYYYFISIIDFTSQEGIKNEGTKSIVIQYYYFILFFFQKGRKVYKYPVESINDQYKFFTWVFMRFIDLLLFLTYFFPYDMLLFLTYFFPHDMLLFLVWSFVWRGLLSKTICDHCPLLLISYRFF